MPQNNFSFCGIRSFCVVNIMFFLLLEVTDAAELLLVVLPEAWSGGYHMRRRVHACHMRRRIHACHRRRIHA